MSYKSEKTKAKAINFALIILFVLFLASAVFISINLFQKLSVGKAFQGLGTTENPYIIDQCAELTESNSIYALNSNIEGSINTEVISSTFSPYTCKSTDLTCLKIKADNIIIDCRGNSITSQRHNIYMRENKNITIKNCIFSSTEKIPVSRLNYNTEASYSNIRIENGSSDILIEDNTFYGGGIGTYLHNNSCNQLPARLENLILRNNKFYFGSSGTIVDIYLASDIQIYNNYVETSATRGISLVSINRASVYDNDITISANNTYDGGGIYCYGCQNTKIESNKIYVTGANSTVPSLCLAGIGYRAFGTINYDQNNVTITKNHIWAYGKDSCGIMSSWWGELIFNTNITHNIIDLYKDNSQGIYLRGRHQDVNLINNTINMHGSISSYFVSATNPVSNVYFKDNQLNSEDNNNILDAYGTLENSNGITVGRDAENLILRRVYYGPVGTKTATVLYPKLEVSGPVGSNQFDLNDIRFNLSMIYLDIESQQWLNKSSEMTVFNSDSLNYADRTPYFETGECPKSICEEIQDTDLYIFELEYLSHKFGVDDGCSNIPNCQCVSDLGCNDNNMCTTEYCDEPTYTCNYVNNINSCDDNNSCTENDVCGNGICLGIPKNCNDNKVCTEDSCLSGICINQLDLTDCICNSDSDCDDSDLCTADSCNPITHSCSNTVSLSACDDQLPCSIDSCSAGVCQHDLQNCPCPENGGVCPFCSDTDCNGNEDCASCESDCGICPPVCGDNECNGLETCSSCGTDCGVCSFCGDTDCEYEETCATCESDCGICPPICGDNKCNSAETCSSCSSDCGICPEICGNNICSETESCLSCSQDCGQCISCGDNKCNGNETCISCSSDCSICPEICGNNICSAEETCATCESDCGICPPICGDNVCNNNEDCASCQLDCGICPPICGDNECNGLETCSSCGTDCGICSPACGNGNCDLFETCSSCESDCNICPPTCGDDVCNNNENCASCQLDCGICPPICGDKICNGNETSLTCSKDCGLGAPSCGDGSCNGVESCSSCSSDCGSCQSGGGGSGGSGGKSSLKQCNDKKDNDGDGLIDWPKDPGCATSRDTNESETPKKCTESWLCDQWEPEVCPPSQIQTRTCTDWYECKTEIFKPSTILNCDYDSSAWEQYQSSRSGSGFMGNRTSKGNASKTWIDSSYISRHYIGFGLLLLIVIFIYLIYLIYKKEKEKRGKKEMGSIRTQNNQLKADRINKSNKASRLNNFDFKTSILVIFIAVIVISFGFLGIRYIQKEIMGFPFEGLPSPILITSPEDGAEYSTDNIALDWFTASDLDYCYYTLDDSSKLISIKNLSQTGAVIDSALIDSPNDVFISGNYAYIVSAKNRALYIIDITDKSNPFRIGSLGLSLSLGNLAIFVSGNYAYISSYTDSKLIIIDVTDKSNPLLQGSVSSSALMYGAADVYVLGDYAYIPAWSNTLTVIDVSDKSNPVIKNSVYNVTSLRSANAIDVQDNYAYIVGYHSCGLAVFDITDSSNPVQAGFSSDCIKINGPRLVDVQGDYAYIAADDGLDIFDISDKSKPLFVSNLSFPGSFLSLKVSGNHLYASDWNNRIVIINIADKSNPEILFGTADVDFSNQVKSYIDISGDYAYHSSESEDSFKIFKISESPKNLTLNSLKIGNHLLSITCYDKLGNNLQSSTISFTTIFVPVCGDEVCSSLETCDDCPLDCGDCPIVCGDSKCSLGEDCETCATDCGECVVCGDFLCIGPTETCATCPNDCDICPACEDGICNGDETCTSCPKDCGLCPSCGDMLCNGDETCKSCETDCGACPVCGDKLCESGKESCSICPYDCGMCLPFCGDNFCNGDEDCDTCENDCNACFCGDGSCNGAENCNTCSDDCGLCAPACGDKFCNGEETCSTCSADCGLCAPACNDLVKNGDETGVDCGGSCSACPTCSDSIQNQGETGVDCGGPCSACSSQPSGGGSSGGGGGGGGSTVKKTTTKVAQECVESWVCDRWSPAVCPESQIQTRTCTDFYSCGTEKLKPAEKRNCEYVVPPNCNDNKQNQEETGVDCGGPCSACEEPETSQKPKYSLLDYVLLVSLIIVVCAILLTAVVMIHRYLYGSKRRR